MWYSLFALSALLSGVLIEAVRRLGSRALLDVPNERSSHSRPTPRGGGLGIVVAVLACWGLASARQGVDVQSAVLITTAAAALIAAISWFDDRRGLRFSVRLVVHLGTALVVIGVLGPLKSGLVPFLGRVIFGGLAWPVTVVWVVGLLNAYNFMDGIDGIAGGQGAVAGLAWVCIGALTSNPAVEMLGGLIAVTCSVFLLFNWAPAKIFMGDVGSATLGFLFAVLPLLDIKLAPTADGAVMATAGLSVVWPFVADASFTFLRRASRGENVFAAHRSHWYQRLVIAGWSHRKVSTLYIGLAVLSSLAGVHLLRDGALASTIAAGVAVGIPLLLLGLVIRAERTANQT
jgi:UDP-N-acetylmuramyl pentapeptide phosphotransferase/UDP-N-acetylglucosamine-1-phosphate transferase